MVFLFLFIIVFSNQYLLFNEELFIILAFFSLCFFVKSNLGGLVFNELKERRGKILTSYLNFLFKKSKSLKTNAKGLTDSSNYLYLLNQIQTSFFSSYNNMFENFSGQTQSDIFNNLESNFVIYFAGLVSQKRKLI